MISILVIVWDCLLGFGGYCLYRNPRLIEKNKTEPSQVQINKVAGLVIMVLGALCAAASAIMWLMKASK